MSQSEAPVTTEYWTDSRRAVAARTAVGPSTRPGLEVIRLIEKADVRGLALVRERAPFTPMPADVQIRFIDQVVLVRAPYRVTFAYAGPDQTWQPTWRGQMQLPKAIRVLVRDAGTGQVLADSSATTLHINAPAECARAENAIGCLAGRMKTDVAKKSGSDAETR